MDSAKNVLLLEKIFIYQLTAAATVTFSKCVAYTMQEQLQYNFAAQAVAIAVFVGKSVITFQCILFQYFVYLFNEFLLCNSLRNDESCIVPSIIVIQKIPRGCI